MQEYQLVPPDGGWGWLVLFGSTLVNILIPGTIKSFGVLFVEFLETFEASPAAAAWIPALCYFLYSSLGPVSSILSVKYSYRTVTIIGGTFAAVGMIISYFAQSVTFLYISYGVFVGTGAGLSFPPTVYIVTSYFVKLRGLANGVCISGSAFGSILLPPILRYLLEEYGYRGAVLIMGGVTLNVWMAALFYEPVEQHMKRVPVTKKTLEDIEEEDAGIVLQFDAIDAGDIIHEENNRPNTPNSVINKGQLPNDIKNFDNNFIRSASAAVVPNLDKSNSRKISTPIKVPIRNPTFTTTEMTSTPSLNAFRERGMSSNKLSRLNSRGGLGKPSPSTSSFQYISTPYHGSTLSFQPNQFSSHLSLKSIASSTKGEEHEEMFPVEEKPEEKKEKFFDLSLLKDPLYLIILISNSTNAISYTNFIILLPAYAISLGFDKSLSAYLISIVSTTDLIGRIGGSALSDLQFIPKTWYFIGGLALSGVSLSLLPLTETYAMLGFCCAVFGLASGTYVGITAVIMADLLGTERLTSSYGISLFVNGVIQLIGPPLCGVWYEQSKTYVPLFTTLGITLVLGASLWGLLPFIKRKNDTNESQSNYNDVE
ncbi:monocarboxylate transporter 13 [Condylostylus longicornis]|uniref:monocarboxylate transporter 13 n=1 Tax=Condylostylus longicornis TaxID=2530218 RepID=UPI00244E4126|nr:monocarboxylate transporter 13 [Condylostylus longicornis]XP_055386302.1 monocarboxylate transporter 13 [Condylostylus longicornis]